jgi:hypothetical protein
LTQADRAAARNFESNLTALAARQPRLSAVTHGASLELTWVFARDGYLTAFEAGERWFAGCSVPKLAARAVLRTLEVGMGTACFLEPRHAAHVRIALDTLLPSQAVICVTPDVRALAVMLRCDDFAADIAAGRLWFAWGDAWAEELGRLLDETPGLATPTRFVRLPGAEAGVIESLVSEAQRVISDSTARRAAALAGLRVAKPRVDPTGRTVCLVARSNFRLWDDAGEALRAAMMGSASDSATPVTWRRFDPDDPAGSSPLALATAAAEADAVLAADVFRADAAHAAPHDVPWVTWVTAGRVLPCSMAGPADQLILADPDLHDAALAAGWPADRLTIAGWPDLPHESRDTDAAAGVERTASVAMIADTCDLEVPESVKEFSSHGLLWERLRATVLSDPFVVPADVQSWLREQATLDGIDPATLDVPAFLNRLIVPAYQQSLAAALLAVGVPLRLHGAGWAELEAFAAHVAGPIRGRDGLRVAAREAAALVYAWPGRVGPIGAHAIDALGVPVIRRGVANKALLLREARDAVARRTSSRVNTSDPVPALSAALLLGLPKLFVRDAQA